MISHIPNVSHGWLETRIFATFLSLALSFPALVRLGRHVLHLYSRGDGEPSLEGLLLSANVEPQIIDAFRVQEVTSIILMLALDSREGFMQTGIRNRHRRLCPQEKAGKAQHCVEAREDHMRHQRPCGRR